MVKTFNCSITMGKIHNNDNDILRKKKSKEKPKLILFLFDKEKEKRKLNQKRKHNLSYINIILLFVSVENIKEIAEKI